MTKATLQNNTESRDTNYTGPLFGMRVLEFGQIAAGPFTGSLLADLGADVVKVERPDGGDGMRNWPPLTKNATGQEFSENFASLNRNKRSIAVDLKDASQLAALRELCGQADVIVENFRPGVLARVGLGYEELARENPRLVYCSISGFGQTGPYAQRGAFDVTVQAISGVMSVTGMPDSEPVKCGVPIGDFCAGLYAAYAIVAQVMEVRRSGQGAFIDCSMLGSLIGVSALQTSEYFGTNRAPRRLGSAHPRNAPYQAFRSSDRYFVIAAGNDKLWAQVCDSVGLPGLMDDPRFKTQRLRAENQEALVPILQEVFAQRSAAYWLEDMDRRGVPCAPINNYPEILSDPHVNSMGIIVDLELPNGVRTKTTSFPVKSSAYSLGAYRSPPGLGAHTQEVFAEWLPESAQHGDGPETTKLNTPPVGRRSPPRAMSG